MMFRKSINLPRAELLLAWLGFAFYKHQTSHKCWQRDNSVLTHLPGPEVSRMQGYQVFFLFLEKTTGNRQYWRNGRLHLRQELQEHLEKKMGRERFAHLKSPWCANSKDNRFWTLRHLCEYNIIKELIFYCSEHIKKYIRNIISESNMTCEETNKAIKWRQKTVFRKWNFFLLQSAFSKGKGGCPGNCVNSKPR